MESAFGKNLTKYRKKCGLTQERLAQMLAVTPQAVSKWEKGSYPDGALLPRLAAILDVSLDVLFGLKEETAEVDILQKLAEEIRSQPEAEKGAYVIELFYQLLHAYHENDLSETHSFPEALTKETFGCLRTDYELALSRLNPDMQYACFLRVPENGINQYVKITPRLSGLFQLLSDETALRILFYAETLPRNFLLTKECISVKLGIPLEIVSDIVERFIWLGIMWELTADTGSTPFPIYGYIHNIALISILTLATSLTNFIANREPDIDIWNKGPFRNPEQQTGKSVNE